MGKQRKVLTTICVAILERGITHAGNSS